MATRHLEYAISASGPPNTPRAAARLDPGSINRWVGILAQLVATHPELAALIQALVTTPADEPNGMGSRDQADP
jgi:hypothetical protein